MTDKLPPSLVTYIETEILPKYHDFDKAHNITHAETVIKESLHLASLFPDINYAMVYTIAAYHDTGLYKGREYHHIVSGEILSHDKRLSEWFSLEQITTMQEAVEDHRASADHNPRSIYGLIVAEADRIIDTDITLRRTVQYGLRQGFNAPKEWHYKRFKQHLHAKYAPGGYLKLYIPNSKNARNLAALQEIIANENLLRESFNKIFAEEKTLSGE